MTSLRGVVVSAKDSARPAHLLFWFPKTLVQAAPARLAGPALSTSAADAAASTPAAGAAGGASAASVFEPIAAANAAPSSLAPSRFFHGK